jgi:hypothetical protein
VCLPQFLLVSSKEAYITDQQGQMKQTLEKQTKKQHEKTKQTNTYRNKKTHDNQNKHMKTKFGNKQTNMTMIKVMKTNPKT